MSWGIEATNGSKMLAGWNSQEEAERGLKDLQSELFRRDYGWFRTVIGKLLGPFKDGAVVKPMPIEPAIQGEGE